MRRALAYVAIAVVLAGCALGEVLADYGDPVDLKPQDLVGTWRSGSHPRLITFAEDDTFSAIDLPYEEFDDFVSSDFDPTRDRLDGSGTWKLDGVGQASNGPKSAVHLSFEQLAGQPDRVGVPMTAGRQDNGEVWLFFFYVGDQGNEWTAYEKCSNPCPSPTPAPLRGSG